MCHGMERESLLASVVSTELAASERRGTVSVAVSVLFLFKGITAI